VAKLESPMTYSSALGAEQCLAGTFRVEFPAQTVEWSDGMYLVHGYQRGEVVPTLALLYSHKHPEDRPWCQGIAEEVIQAGGYFSMYHRIIDAQGRVRHVLTSGDAIRDARGNVTALEGVMLDLTSTLRRETEQTAHDAVVAATSTRSVIDLARGILMGRLLVGSEAAFQLLVNDSGRRNVKLALVASELVTLAERPDGADALEAAVRRMLAWPKAAPRKLRQETGT
jgi:PAS domain S-box-containing protein